MGTTSSAPLNPDVLRHPQSHRPLAGQASRTGRYSDHSIKPDPDDRTLGGGGGGIMGAGFDKYRIEHNTTLGLGPAGAAGNHHTHSQGTNNGGRSSFENENDVTPRFCDDIPPPPSNTTPPQDDPSGMKRRADEVGTRATAAAELATGAQAPDGLPPNLGPAEGPLRKRRARELQEAEAVQAAARAASRAGSGGGSNNSSSFTDGMMQVSQAGQVSVHPAVSSGVMTDGIDGGGGVNGGGCGSGGSDGGEFTLENRRRRGGGDGRVTGGGGEGGGVHGVDDAGFVSFPNAHSLSSGEFLSGGMRENGAFRSGGSGTPIVSTAGAVGITPTPISSFPLSTATTMNTSSTSIMGTSPSSTQLQMPVSGGYVGGGRGGVGGGGVGGSGSGSTGMSSFMSGPTASAGASGALHNPSSGGLAVSSAAAGTGVFPHSYNFLPMSGHGLLGAGPGSALTPEAEAANAAVAAAAAAANAAFAAARRPSFSSSGGVFQAMTAGSMTAPSGAGGNPSDFDGGMGMGGGGGGALAPLTAIFLGSPSGAGVSFSGGSVGGVSGRAAKPTGHTRKNSRDNGRKLGGSGTDTPRRNRSRPTCTADGCQQRPLFGIEGTKQAIFCSQHKAPGMTNVLCRRCEVEGCKHQPSFAMEGSRAVRCATHKTPGMVNVAAPRCKFPGCMVCPSFGRPGERKASFCATHRREGDVDLVTRRCHHEGCIHRPVFGHPPEKKAYYCASHKLEGMVNVFAPRCAYPNCTHQPSYGLPGSRRSTHCGKHRTQFHENKR